MTRKPLFAMAVALAMSGCSTLDHLTGHGVVTERTSGFDNATLIEASPNALVNVDGMWTESLELGARWSSATPDNVALVMSWNAGAAGNLVFLDTRAFFVNIDGNISQYSAGQPASHAGSVAGTAGSNRLYGTNEVVIPYSVLERMVAARSCRIRVQTSNGYKDFDFTRAHALGGKPTAIVAISELMAKVAVLRNKA
ncbi:hypothetical protein [Frateuria sp. STR12]|uniref:hypothetical protein n=1 Tax=Frateuria hangzhouensis TaxID=2995589 RepID=UPI002260F9A7|nr:hypothetical protein [Frateuria sp. STR12]MCX7513434.1 hypothetical protein [Frateuria sp. STR12]